MYGKNRYSTPEMYRHGKDEAATIIENKMLETLFMHNTEGHSILKRVMSYLEFNNN